MSAYFWPEVGLDAGVLLADGVDELVVPPEAGGADGAAGVDDEVAAGVADDSAAVVVAVGVGLVVSPVGGFILSE
ncbi:conserved hypothetical protein [Nitrospira lenta]|uniref:Uncharacterized protein n=1 Tax=Nitrospira lenta TaxID=1436998 RepID=A0A330LAR8_9BACT|nr:conserved hypothetical protein [Nitrospira lenta]